MESLEKEVLEWHRETFPNATQDAISTKCAEEVIELFEVSMDKGSSLKEYLNEVADVIITHIALINKASNGEYNLSDIVRHKLNINKKRVWGPEIENGDRPRVKTS